MELKAFPYDTSTVHPVPYNNYLDIWTIHSTIILPLLSTTELTRPLSDLNSTPNLSKF